MAGTYSKVKTVTTGDIISASDRNAEHDNHINHCDFAGLGSYSSNATQMQSTADPYPGSVESLAIDGKGELERMRYVTKQISGKTQWYIDPDTSLATIFSAIGASTTQILAPVGSVSAPGISFSGTGFADNGLYLTGTSPTEVLNFSVRGAQVALMSTVIQFTVDTNVVRSQVGGTVTFDVENTDTTNGASHAALLMQTDGASAGDPFVHWNLTSPSVHYSMGIDNSDSDKLVLSNNATLGTSNILTISGTTTTFAGQVNFSGVVLLPNGTTTNPSWGLTNNTDTGAYYDGTRIYFGMDFTSSPSYISLRSGTEGATVFVNGSEAYDLSTDFFPVPDNTHKCGKTGQRFTEVWATNGTIQTSISETKSEIIEWPSDKIKIPKAAKYKRPGQKHDSHQLGFIADNLPEEAFAADDQGNRSHQDIYTSSVIAMLCGAARNDYDRLGKLDLALGTYKTTLDDHEARLKKIEQKLAA
jgi:hypothetical protein